MSWRKVVARTGLAMVGVLLAMQLVPYGWTHANPPVTQAVVWADPNDEALARGACYDCHSNETEWPAYSYVAPASWLVRRDVDNGRKALNLSELDHGGGEELDEARDQIEDGAMPPRQYQLAHPAARLSPEEQRQLIDAFDQIEEADERRQDGDDDDDSSGRG